MVTREYDHMFKLLIIGESGVGKSNIMTRFADNSFSANHITTIGVDFKIRTVIVNETKIKLQIWDTAGQERFRTLTSTYYRGTHGVLVVFDVTNGESFANVKVWLSEIDKYCDNVQRILVGNKCDDRDHRTVSHADAKRFAELMHVEYFEVSAKDNINIEEVFVELSRLALNAKLKASNQTYHKPNGIKVEKTRKDKKKSNKGCC